jgi:hypothetical protein
VYVTYDKSIDEVHVHPAASESAEVIKVTKIPRSLIQESHEIDLMDFEGKVVTFSKPRGLLNMMRYSFFH